MAQHERMEANHQKNSSYLVGLTLIVATSQSEDGLRRFSKLHHLVGHTHKIPADQSEAETLVCVQVQSWWDIDHSFY